MVTMSRPCRGIETSNNDIRSKLADRIHDVTEYFVFLPVLECVFRVLGIAKISGSREQLDGPVNSTGLQ